METCFLGSFWGRVCAGARPCRVAILISRYPQEVQDELPSFAANWQACQRRYLLCASTSDLEDDGRTPSGTTCDCRPRRSARHAGSQTMTHLARVRTLAAVKLLKRLLSSMTPLPRPRLGTPLKSTCLVSS